LGRLGIDGGGSGTCGCFVAGPVHQFDVWPRGRLSTGRDLYELCWYFGGSQSDIACLQAADLDYERRCFVYDRLKTGNMGGMRRRFSSLP